MKQKQKPNELVNGKNCFFLSGERRGTAITAREHVIITVRGKKLAEAGGRGEAGTSSESA